MVALLRDCSNGGEFMTTDEQLTYLIREVKQHLTDSLEWQEGIVQIVDIMLRSRKICRPPQGQSLFGIYQEMYQSVRQQLLDKVGEDIGEYNLKTPPVREWVNTLRDNAFKEILNDARLKQLAITAQETQPQTQERGYALKQLVEAIRLSGRLIRPHRNICSPGSYNLIYEEAVNRTLLYVCQKIEKYDPTRGEGRFMNWVNFRLERLFIEVRREFPNGDDFSPDFDIPQPGNYRSLGEEIRNCIAEDAKNIFKKAHIRNRPDANFQAIALATTSGKNWEEISVKFGGIKVSTLSTFFQRCCENFEAEIKEYLSS